MKTIAFFNCKSGVGTSTLVYHLAWTYADLGLSVIAADFDPQANLTSMFLDDARLDELWPDRDHPHTISGAMQPLLAGSGDVHPPHVEAIEDRLGLLVGDLALVGLEDLLDAQWLDSDAGNPRAIQVLAAFWRIVEQAARAREASIVLLDLGPSLGAVTRSALIAADHIVIPLAPDHFAPQALRTVGPALRRWREDWAKRRARHGGGESAAPRGAMAPAGYVVVQHELRMDRPLSAPERWLSRIPDVYRAAILEGAGAMPPTVREEPSCLSVLKRYRSLMSLAEEARKPMFHLKAADGALGGHARAVQDCYRDFRALAKTIATRCDIPLG
jgi:cellulose biosynthesis protein BcsQ